MRKRFGQLAGALALLCMLIVGAAACAAVQETQTLTDLLLEVSRLPQITAEGEIHTSIKDRAMEEDLEQSGLPADLLRDLTIKYQVNSDNEAMLCEIKLSTDFAFYDEPLPCTLYLTDDCIYINAQDALRFCQLLAKPAEYAKAQKELGAYDWIAVSLEDDFDSPTSYYNVMASYYGLIDSTDYEQLLDEVERFRDTIGQAYASFSAKAITGSGSSFKLELDNAGLADLINGFIAYTLDNSDKIAQACIDYVNVSAIFTDEYREEMIEMIQEMAEQAKQVTEQQRQYVQQEVDKALKVECPMDFNLLYDFAKTAADTYTLEEKVSIAFDEEYYGEASDVLISIKNTSKAVKDLQINIPTENIVWPDEDELELPKADM